MSQTSTTAPTLDLGQVIAPSYYKLVLLVPRLVACTSTEVVDLDGWRDVRVPEELWMKVQEMM